MFPFFLFLFRIKCVLFCGIVVGFFKKKTTNLKLQCNFLYDFNLKNNNYMIINGDC